MGAESEIKVSFSQIIDQAFGVKRLTINAPKIYQKVLEVVGEFNQAEGRDRLQPMIKGSQYQARKRYFFAETQAAEVVTLLKVQQAKFEPVLPFRATPEEMDSLKKGEDKILEQVIMRMYYLGLNYYSKSVPEELLFKMIEEVVNHPSTWETLLDSDPSLDNLSNFRRAFLTSIYRKTATIHRANLRLQPLPRLRLSPLRHFFTNHPLGSPLSDRLLNILTYKQRAAFIKFYLQGQKASVNTYTIARKRLEQLVKSPANQWPKVNLTAILNRMLTEDEKFFQQALTKAPARQSYLKMRYQQNLSIEEISQRLHKSEEAVRSLAYRVRQELLESDLIRTDG